MSLAAVGARELSFTLAQPGAHWVANALAVLAAVHAVGADLGLPGWRSPNSAGCRGGGARFIAKVAGGDVLVIDESYNASPVAMRATLGVLAEEKGRHVAILGDMLELGSGSPAYHAALAEPIVAARVDTVLLVGEAMRALAEALEGKANIVHVRDAAAALERLDDVLAPGDAVLVKGSNGIGLSRLIARLGGAH